MSLVLALVAGGMLVALAMGVGLWLGTRPGDPDLDRRLRSVAVVLGTGGEAAAAADTSIFRRRRDTSWLYERIEHRFSMIEARGSFPKAVALGFLAGVGVSVAAYILQFGTYIGFLMPAGWLAGSWGFLSIRDSTRRAAFSKQFPEVVDHLVRLSRAGLPAVEAISAVAGEAPEPVKSLMQKVSDELASGLDPEVVLRENAARVRIPEFTLFSAALCLQRTTGGGISAALGNLSTTLRARLEVVMKTHAATAQTRITLWVLSGVPVFVLGSQFFTNPEAIDVLLKTESGGMLLRWGLGLIVTGLLVARGIASRFGR